MVFAVGDQMERRRAINIFRGRYIEAEGYVTSPTWLVPFLQFR